VLWGVSIKTPVIGLTCEVRLSRTIVGFHLRPLVEV